MIGSSMIRFSTTTISRGATGGIGTIGAGSGVWRMTIGASSACGDATQWYVSTEIVAMTTLSPIDAVNEMRSGGFFVVAIDFSLRKVWAADHRSCRSVRASVLTQHSNAPPQEARSITSDIPPGPR